MAGLASAWELVTGNPACRVVLIEGSGRLGGKIGTESFAGLELDTGPDSFLARVPAATDLAREAGLGEDLVAPATGQAYLWARGRLRALPTGLVLGVPADPIALARSDVLPRSAVARATLDLVLPGTPVPADADVSVGALVRRRMGRQVQLGLVDPLLGGINAGHTDDLSAAVAAPQLLAAGRRDRSLMRGLRAAGVGGSSSGAVITRPRGGGGGESRTVAPPSPGPSPVFLTVRGGLSRLVDALGAKVATRGEVALGDRAVALVPDGQRWVIRLAGGRQVHADAVVLAAPAPAAANLLRTISPAVAAALSSIGSASVALTVMSYDATSATRPLVGSGFLVPRAEGRTLTAASWVGTKWPHLSQPGRIVVRASVGRIDDRRFLEIDDTELVERLHGELAEAMGLRRRPLEVAVHRWPDAFPQFGVGHLERIAEAERRLTADAPGVILVGAALRGVGLATVVAGARLGAGAARTHVMRSTIPPHGVAPASGQTD
ncbi:MAG: protoporphyrinogen oxidase [Acidimicrobiales bacterium]